MLDTIIFGIILLDNWSMDKQRSMVGEGSTIKRKYPLLKVSFSKKSVGLWYELFKDILQRVSVDIRKVLEYINLRFEGRKSQHFYWRDRKLAELARVNHPDNCYRVDLGTLESNLTNLVQVQFNFYANSSSKVELIMEDKRRSLSRTFKFNSFGMNGPRMLIEDASQRYFK